MASNGPFGYNYATRPKPASVKSKVSICWHIRRKGDCNFGDNCRFAHSYEEQQAWIREISGSTRSAASESINNTSPVVRRQSSSLRDPLSAENYKKKFTELVEAEREEHRGLLKQRLKGRYHYEFAGHKCPAGVKMKSKASYAMYGKLSGLSGEDFAYVKQASSSVTLHDEESNATADICFRSYRHDPYCMYLAFFHHEFEFMSSCEVKAEFNLKESYFKDLVSSISKLNIVSRLVPSDESFRNPSCMMEDVESCKDSCSDEQFEALKVIINTAPSSPPILLTGAFGTGKSTLLATCALYLLSKSSKTPIRILVCTQQRLSADIFLKLYTNKVWKGKNKNVFVIREYGYDNLDPHLEDYYKSSADFKNIWSETRNKSSLVITTCLTASHLYFLPRGYFTHIFIDEGSHMREPEAIAPLQLATEETKIVIAGDPNQVGPANLVRGTVARANMLNVSLLQRLKKLYSSNADCQIMVWLTHNYRCHPDILKLVSDLFYSSSLTWDEQESHPATHRKHKFPLVFICNDVDKQAKTDIKQKEEAKIVAEKVIELAKQMPPSWSTNKPMKNFLITSPCENQIGHIFKEFKDMDDFPEIRTIFQGQEYQAVILSTTEPVNLDGSTLDPTKSFCDPYVFNTAVTRAKSLVLAVGNPFLLLNMEKSFARNYGDEHSTQCWSTFLELCIENKSFEFHPCLKYEESEKEIKVNEIKEAIAVNHKLKNLEKDILNLQNENCKLQEENSSLQEDNSSLQEEISYLQDEISNLLEKYKNLDEEKSKIQSEYEKEKDDLKKKILELERQLLSQHHSHDVTKIVEDAPESTGKPIEQTPTKDATKVMVQDNFEHVFANKLSIKHENRIYEKKKRLGKGGFAKVYHVLETGDKEQYALKVIQCKTVSKKILREVSALQDLEHERIVRYVNHWVCDDDEGWWSSSSQVSRGAHQYLFILTELCRDDTLCDWLITNSDKNKRIKKEVTTFFTQITDGLVFIHEKDYVHRDLKPSNILFSCSNEELKIGDFGLVMDESSENAVSSQNVDSNSTFKGYGTPYYVSPEQRNKGRVDSKTDIYALGVILFELYYPDITTSERRQRILGNLTGKKDFPTNFENYFPKVHSSILKMIDHDPSERPTAREVEKLLKNNTEISGTSEVESSSEFIPICDE